MDTHINLSDIAFSNLRVLVNYINCLTDNRFIYIVKDNLTNSNIKLSLFHEISEDLKTPTQLEMSHVIFFTFNQIFNHIRSRPSEFNERSNQQIRGICNLLDTAHCAIYEFIENHPNPEKTTLLKDYTLDIEFKIDRIFQKNVDISTCQYLFEPLLNICYYKMICIKEYLFPPCRRNRVTH